MARLTFAERMARLKALRNAAAPTVENPKYHHGPCNAHCRCGRIECAEIHRQLKRDIVDANRNGPNELGVYVTGKCVRCGERFAPDGGSIQPEPSEPTEPARRFCACGQEIGERALAAFEWDDDKPDGTQPLCGDCLTQNWRYGADRSKSKGLDTRIAAARAVTDEAEGAWMTATSEGP